MKIELINARISKLNEYKAIYENHSGTVFDLLDTKTNKQINLKDKENKYASEVLQNNEKYVLASISNLTA